MILAPAYSTVEVLISEGRFAEAHTVLASDRRRLEAADSLAFELLTCELEIELGEIDDACRRAAAIVRRQSADLGMCARAHRVLGRGYFCVGDLEGSRRELRTARSLCLQSKDELQLARIDVTHLSLFLGVDSLETALSALPQVRKAVIRAGQPHLMAELRLCVARWEARRHSAGEAKKHLAAAGELLKGYPSVWLSGLLSITLSNVAALLGDLDDSLDFAREAMLLADQSGHSRTRAAAAINMSHVYCSRGDLAEAKRLVEMGLGSAGANLHVRLAALDSWANLLITAGQYHECREVFAQVSGLLTDASGERLHWDVLTELFTRARLAQAEGDWQEACAALSEGVRVADGCGDHLSGRRMRLGRSKCFALLGRQNESCADISEGMMTHAEHPIGLTQYYGALAAAGRSTPTRARQHLARAIRISRAIFDQSLTQDLLVGMEGLGVQGDDPDTPPAPDLDTAVSLLELGGHAHILGREALAVLDAAGCTRGAALVARTADGVRVIEAKGWDERQALAAARQPDNHDVIAVGEHRDEPWQLVAEPRPELEHRCALIAIRKLIDTALTLDRFRREEKQRAALWPSEALDGNPESIWASEEMSELMSVARKIAPTPLSILLTGETGTGKEMLARVIHRASDRADRPLLPFNCTAVPRDMLESQLFGYRKGAFTGADTAFPGVIRSAAGGTLFLDEIAEVGIDVQPKLLRFLETHEIHPLGEPHPITVDVRVIAATNARLEQLVAEGRFREDLFYRLNIVRLKLPPLRERREEIPALVEHHLRKYRDELKKGRLTLSDETLEYLLLYSWPGNIRQLANEVRRMVAMAEPDSALTPTLLSPEIQASRRTIPAVAPLAAATTTDPEVRVRIDQPMPVAVQLLEQTMVRNALDRAHGRVEQAARLLGISRKGLFLKRRRWGLQHHRDS
ncbi:MAG: sigma 54-interacting transcriptional regulator [Acidobacteriota bacterium]